MCGIFGAHIFDKESESTFCIRVMKELAIRGLHSFGMCYADDLSYVVLKSFQRDCFDFFYDCFNESNATSFIFHNRYSTSGDWNEMKNNQPIVCKDIGAIAMNGVLTMKTKQEYEADFFVKCDSDNDAEIFLRMIEKGVVLEDFLKEKRQCSFAGLFLLNTTIFGLRNNKRPLYHYKSEDGEYLVSTLDVIKRAGGNINNAKILKPYERYYL